ncbi:class IV adenylate cyclase [Candidatus Uhrbacteria bacterium]|nr:class IV adenylate cyclase [Candidatus Uhrbacteria bacterium]
MKEIEAKILEINKDALEKKLRAVGAKKVFDGNVSIRYFDTQKHQLKKRGIILRLRKKGECGELTVKSNFVRTKNAKTSTEEETPVEFESARAMLLTLGYREIARGIKHRIEYTLGSVKFEIDKLPGIPWFLEIEAPSEKKLKAMVERLGFSQKDIKPWWGEDVKAYYGTKSVIR